MIELVNLKKSFGNPPTEVLKGVSARIEEGEIDPSFIITHRMTLDEAPRGYRIFRDKDDECIKVVLKPQES